MTEESSIPTVASYDSCITRRGHLQPLGELLHCIAAFIVVNDKQVVIHCVSESTSSPQLISWPGY